MSFSSMYIGATGMKAHGEGMSVLGNNIANVNTVGFKESDFHFADLISEHVTTGEPGGVSQRGLGVGVNDVQINYHQGATNPTNTTTDLAINGKGFFRVSDNGELFYTRAGTFRFDKDGFLVDPHGYRVQGQQISDGGAAATGDIQLSLDDNGQFYIEPEATTRVSLYTNLGDDGHDASTSTTNPFFAMINNWDAGNTQAPLNSSAFSYQDTVTVYDGNGKTQELSVYYDEVTMSNAGGVSYLEYMVTLPPDAVAEGNGVLMMGTLTFNNEGQLINQSAYTMDDPTADATDLSNWTPAAFSEEGFAQMNVSYAATGDIPASSTTLSLDLGLRNTSGGWQTRANSTAADIGSNAGALPGATWESQPPSTTHYAGTSSTIMQTQNGFPSGFLNRIDVGTDGIVSGYYSNGQVGELYQINLYNFPSEYGLRSEGGNLYSATNQSGAAIEGSPEIGGLGSISQSSLEESNVDLAEEMVMMITTQRGFQANGKTITTSDSLLNTAISMKR